MARPRPHAIPGSHAPSAHDLHTGDAPPWRGALALQRRRASATSTAALVASGKMEDGTPTTERRIDVCVPVTVCVPVGTRMYVAALWARRHTRTHQHGMTGRPDGRRGGRVGGRLVCISPHVGAFGTFMDLLV